jgi:hypothetical protein
MDKIKKKEAKMDEVKTETKKWGILVLVSLMFPIIIGVAILLGIFIYANYDVIGDIITQPDRSEIILVVLGMFMVFVQLSYFVIALTRSIKK